MKGGGGYGDCRFFPLYFLEAPPPYYEVCFFLGPLSLHNPQPWAKYRDPPPSTTTTTQKNPDD